MKINLVSVRLILAVALSCLGVTLAHAACPARAVPIAVGQSIQAAVNAAPAGSSFCLGTGAHRGQSVVPKNNQKFFAADASQMLGSKRVTAWIKEGSIWYAAGQTAVPPTTNIDECIPSAPLCNQALAVYHSNVPLRQVASKALVNADTFWRDAPNSRIYIGRDPTKKPVEISTTEKAFHGTATGVVIDGLTIANYAPKLQQAAIFAPDATGWWIRRTRVLRVYSVGADVGSDSIIENSVFRDNGEMGIACGGSGIIIRYNQIHNNGRWAGLSPEWEGGALKCTKIRGTYTMVDGKHHGTGLTIHNNGISGNGGPGPWVDEGTEDEWPNSGVVIRNNNIFDNDGPGISYEISKGGARIIGNKLHRNGRASVQPNAWMWGGCWQSYDSEKVVAWGNDCIVAATHGNGPMVISQGGRIVNACGNHFHHNRIIFRGSNATTGVTGDNLPRFCGADINRLDHNAYFVARQADMTGPRWAWQDDEYGWAQWRTVSGQEKQGTIAVGVPAGVSQ